MFYSYTDLDQISNEIDTLRETVLDEDKKLARYLLVVMVRGPTSSLKFPLAAFATGKKTYRHPIFLCKHMIYHLVLTYKGYL